MPDSSAATFSPLCVTYIRKLGVEEWIEVHRSEAVKDGRQLEFTERPLIPYSFGEKQWIKFEIMNSSEIAKDTADGNTEAMTSPDKEESLGFTECSLAELIVRGRVRTRK